jgi:hypothetical protein
MLLPVFAAIVAAMCLLSTPRTAQAKLQDNAHDKPWTLNLGTGLSVGLPYGGVAGHFSPDFQYHFFGGDVGPALGAQAHMLFASHLFGMQIGPIFLWDFRVFSDPNAKLYLAPLVSPGYAFATSSGLTAHFFYMTFGGQFKAVFNDWIGIYVRPIDFQVLAAGGGAVGAWRLTVGVTFNFG